MNLFHKTIGALATQLLTLISFVTIAQRDIRPLKLGEKLPDLELRLYKGDTVQQCHLGDFKGKVVLLDLWGASCQPCVANMPGMLQLQEQFRDKFKVIYYTPDKLEEYKALLARIPNTYRPSVQYAITRLPMQVEDTVINALFPSPSLGAKVWIGADGIFRSRTMDEPTATLVQDIIDGKSPPSEEMVLPDMASYNVKEWFAKRVGLINHLSLLDYSILTRLDSKYVGRGDFWLNEEQFQKDPISGKIIGFDMINASLASLYAMAYYHKSIKNSNFLFEMKDAKSFFQPPQLHPTQEELMAWRSDHYFCYAVKMSPDDNEDIFDRMKRTLDHYFGLTSRVEKRKLRCWVLKKTTTDQRLKSKGVDGWGGEVDDTKQEGICHFVINNGRIKDLCISIEAIYTSVPGSSEPVIDETHIDYPIDLNILWSRGHPPIQALRKELQKNGLDLVPEYRERNILVLSDKKNNNTKH